MNRQSSEPYHFKPEELPPSMRKHLMGTGEIQFADESFTYGILDPAVAPVHNVVGMPEGQNLIASSAIPSDLLPFYLHHEILCNRQRAGEEGRCAQIEQDLMENAPAEIRSRLLKARRRTFEDLVALYKIDLPNPKTPFHREIAGTTLFLRRKMEELGIEMDQVDWINA